MISRSKPDHIRTFTGVLIRTTIVSVLVIAGLVMVHITARAFPVPDVDRSGYEMRVRLDRTLSSTSSRVGDKFIATVADRGPFNLARISGHVESITPSRLFKGVTEIHLSFDRIRFADQMGYPINAEIIKLYDVSSGEEVDAEVAIETAGHRRPRTLKRTGIGALAGGIFGETSGPSGRPRVVSAGPTAAYGRKELILDQDVEMLLRVYTNDLYE
jgi:hypothetical protein